MLNLNSGYEPVVVLESYKVNTGAVLLIVRLPDIVSPATATKSVAADVAAVPNPKVVRAVAASASSTSDLPKVLMVVFAGRLNVLMSLSNPPVKLSKEDTLVLNEPELDCRLNISESLEDILEANEDESAVNEPEISGAN